jgi:hypothetical protein
LEQILLVAFGFQIGYYNLNQTPLMAFGFQKTKTTKLRSHKKVGLVVFWLITHMVWERESKKGIGKHVKKRYSTPFMTSKMIRLKVWRKM